MHQVFPHTTSYPKPFLLPSPPLPSPILFWFLINFILAVTKKALVHYYDSFKRDACDVRSLSILFSFVSLHFSLSLSFVFYFSILYFIFYILYFIFYILYLFKFIFIYNFFFSLFSFLSFFDVALVSVGFMYMKLGGDTNDESYVARIRSTAQGVEVYQDALRLASTHITQQSVAHVELGHCCIALAMLLFEARKAKSSATEYFSPPFFSTHCSPLTHTPPLSLALTHWQSHPLQPLLIYCYIDCQTSRYFEYWSLDSRVT